MHRNKEINSIIFSMNKIVLYIIKNLIYTFYMHYILKVMLQLLRQTEKKFLNIKTFCVDIDW